MKKKSEKKEAGILNIEHRGGGKVIAQNGRCILKSCGNINGEGSNLYVTKGQLIDS